MKELTFIDPRFESTVRDQLDIYDRPIFGSDVLKVGFLDCSNFTFRETADLPTLMLFRNLHTLHLEIAADDFSFLRAFPKLTELSICCVNQTFFDVRSLTHLDSLHDLFLCADPGYSIELRHLDALPTLKNLRDLSLHDVGSIDLAPLCEMPWLEYFSCCYAAEVKNIDAIGHLTDLKSLSLVDLAVDDLSFLDLLPDKMELTACGLEIKNGFERQRLTRFLEHDISEITVNGNEVLYEDRHYLI